MLLGYQAVKVTFSGSCYWRPIQEGLRCDDCSGHLLSSGSRELFRVEGLIKD